MPEDNILKIKKNFGGDEVKVKELTAKLHNVVKIRAEDRKRERAKVRKTSALPRFRKSSTPLRK